MKQFVFILLWLYGGSTVASVVGHSDKDMWGVEDATFNYASTGYCQSDADPTPSVTTPGGIFSSTAGLDIDIATGEIDLDASMPGTYTVTYETTSPPDIQTSNVTINAVEDASFSYASANYCGDDSNPVPNSITTPGGTFSSTPGLVFVDNATGEVDLSGSTLGTYTVTYTTGGTCPSGGTFSLTITARGDASFNYTASDYCPTDTDPVATITGDAGGTFTATAGLIINIGTGEIDLSASTPGVHTITYTTGGICSDSSTFNISIIDDGAPVAQPATNITCDAFAATWNPVFGATSYEIDVAEDSDFTTMVAGYSATSTTDTFLDVSGLMATETYYYQVRASTSCGTSLNSDTISVEVLDIPGAITNLSASNPDCDGFKVSWDAVTYASNYLLEVSKDGFVTIDISQSIPSTSLSIAGREQGTVYEYRVTPQNVCGSGPASTETYQTNDVPVIPTNIAASQIACDGAMLTWDEVTEADEYLVELSTDAFATIDNYPISNDTLVISGLTSATTYAYRIIPGNACGTGDTTAVLTFTTDSLPSAPVDTLLVVEHNQVTVAWESIINADTYSVEVATDNLFGSTVSTTVLDSTNTKVTGLIPLTTYYLRIFADNTCGSGPFSDTLTFTTPQNPLVIDSLALVDFYNATDGPNWTDNTNWLSGDISTWHGVSVTDNRVVRLELSNNQLVGSFPATMSDLTGLEYANLQDNVLSGILNPWISIFSEATDSLLLNGNQIDAVNNVPPNTLGVIDLSNNVLTFEDIIYVVDSASNLIYSPQAKVGTTTNTFRNVEDSYTLSLGIDASVVGNQYVWYRDGVAVDTTTVGEYIMNPIVVSDDGVYICEVTNLAAPDLTLVSNPMTVNVQAKPNSLTFSPVANVNFGTTSFVLNATATSGLPVFYEAIEGDSLVDIQGDMVTTLGIGQVTIRATQPGDDFHEAATPITRQFTINQGTQTIAFTAISDQDITLTDSVALAISASSELPIDFSIDGPAELDGDILRLLDTGTVTVTAAQAGNEFYQPAFPVSQSFLVFTSDTVPPTTEPPVDSTLKYSITVQLASANEVPAVMASLNKASGSSFSVEQEQPLVSGSGIFSEVAGGFYSMRLTSSDAAYLPTYLGGRLTLAQADILGITQDTTLSVALISKPDTTAQQGVTVGGTLVLEGSSGGRLEESAMAGITVYLVSTTDQSIVGYGVTNGDGKFYFPNIPLGDYFFLADYEGVDMRDNQIEVNDKALTLSVEVERFINVVGIEEEEPPALITSIGQESEVNIAAYPNPVGDRLTLEIPASWLGSRAVVTNTAGQQVANQALTKGRSSLLLQALPAGLYYVQIQSQDQSHVMKIVKQ
ncbi:fibronectin type III domain-containing protein [Tunicatimonas pelagia]|uniref:fibronectin type III domain-containing protein n=1 Tax=Tunicatimonas pelagia TaxID=931531 RepID=UPI0026671E8D|nr:T9SS type A sorting domain-containing protein [Tunicatimonas pelagia]WKN45628.1 T9SS type A sorting domain-containing protein [Tunicatimonas pelagia]